LAQIRHIHIKRFRVINELIWFPKPGLNCLIGSGDSGKSTVLDAIDLAIGARRSYPFTDSDFFQLNTKNPIEIFVTIGALDDQLKNIEAYGMFLRGFNSATGEIVDEPLSGKEVVLTVKLTVGEDLEPDWLLYSERAVADGLERRLQWKHRELISSARLGAAPDYHFAWGNKSILNKLSEKNINASLTLAQLGRKAREAFSGGEVAGINAVLIQVKNIANKLGVSVGDLKALLDANSVSLAHGAISLHNDDNTPLRQLGTGSSRLLISGLQKCTNISKILIVDEAEYGLEPFRITRLLNELGSKDESQEQQVFITTHSPYVLRELKAEQLHVVRKVGIVPFPPPNTHCSHYIHTLTGGNEEQSTLRVCAEAFFSRSVIVCEGKTEIGIVKGIDLYCQDQGHMSIQAHGAYWADGGGQTQFQRAKIFNMLGYPTAIFKDSDKQEEEIEETIEAKRIGIKIFEWGENNATEDALFKSCPEVVIPALIDLAVERKGRESINSNIQKYSGNSFNLEDCRTKFQDTMRTILSKAAKSKNGAWYKDIEPAENIARSIIAPHYSNFGKLLTKPINELFAWAKSVGGFL